MVLGVTKTEDAWNFDIDKMKFDLSEELKKRLISASEACKENDWWSVDLWFDDYLWLGGEDKIEETEYRSGADYFKVRKDYITIFSENKYNPQCIIESEEFFIKK